LEIKAGIRNTAIPLKNVNPKTDRARVNIYGLIKLKPYTATSTTLSILMIAKKIAAIDSRTHFCFK